MTLPDKPPGHWDWLFDPEKYGTDDQGRRLVNAHGDVDVVRTEGTMHAVQLPVERGSLVTIDGETEKFCGFDHDTLLFVDPGDDLPGEDEWAGGFMREGVQHFNTRVRDADEVSVEAPK